MQTCHRLGPEMAISPVDRGVTFLSAWHFAVDARAAVAVADMLMDGLLTYAFCAFVLRMRTYNIMCQEATTGG